jgi:plastocyanin
VGDGWKQTSVARLDRCDAGCRPGTQIALLDGEPLVVVADPVSGQVIAAQRAAGTWNTEVVATGATGGASLATQGSTATIAFYTGSGVSLATGRFGSWSVEDVAELTAAVGDQEADVPTAPTTSVAFDGQDTIWIAWQDSDGIHLASRTGEGSEEVDLPATSGGVNPSLAVTEDGSSVYLAWYDSTEGDLRLGTYGEIKDLLIAAPPPLPSPPGPGGGGNCGQDGQIVLDIVAEGIAFNPTCLVAPAGEAFTINFDDRDDVSLGQHNIAIAVDEASVFENPIFRGELVSGPATVEYDVPAMDEGTYFFHCDIHASMTGALAVVAGGGGTGGGGGGG